jgi:hypothetical protein
MNPYLHYYFVSLSLLIAAIYFTKLKRSFLSLFLPYLLITLLLEIVADYLYQSYKHPTGGIYNLLNLASHVFYAHIFYSYSNVYKYKRFIVLVTSVYLTGSLTYYLSTSFYNFSNEVLAAGGLLQVILACLYFYEFQQNRKSLHRQHYRSGIWIASGVLLFYAGITICYSLYQYILIQNFSFLDQPLQNAVPRLLSIILYSCIAIALLIWKQPQKI